jgi:hypothetical protein
MTLRSKVFFVCSPRVFWFLVLLALNRLCLGIYTRPWNKDPLVPREMKSDFPAPCSKLGLSIDLTWRTFVCSLSELFLSLSPM